MLVTFSCDAYENILMFGNIAQELLKLMGQSGTVPGAIMAADVPEALENLEKRIANLKRTGSTVTEDAEGEPTVSLAHRALPLINMLKAANKSHSNIMWR